MQKTAGITDGFFKFFYRLKALCIKTLTHLFTRAADGFSFAACFLFRIFFMAATQFHFAENAFSLQFFLQNLQRLVNVITDNCYLNHLKSPLFSISYLLKLHTM